MKYVIEKRSSFQILAMSREFSEKECKTEIPEFWTEYYAKGFGKIACGQYGVCYGGNGHGVFRYAIGNACRVEKRNDGSLIYHIFNCPDLNEIPSGFELLTIPEATWATFECLGPLPQSIQQMWPRITQEWLPDADYEILPGYDLEEYGKCESPADAQKADYRCLIHIPVKSKSSSRFQLQIGTLTVADFLRLYQSVGWSAPPEEQVKEALKNSLVVFSVYDGEALVGMGRLIGDHSMAYMVRDVVIAPTCQRKGAGSFLMIHLLDWIAHELPGGWRASCELFAAQGKGAFYQRFGFEPLPNAVIENGMKRMVESAQ